MIVYKVQDIRYASGHSASHRKASIGISVTGYFRNPGEPAGSVAHPDWSPEGGMPSATQYRALIHLLRYLQEYYGIADAHIHGHFQHSKWNCPGYDYHRFILDYEQGLTPPPPQRVRQIVRPAEQSADPAPCFCYPVQVAGAPEKPFLPRLEAGGDPGDAVTLGKSYMANTSSRWGGGDFPLDGVPSGTTASTCNPRRQGCPCTLSATAG